MIYECLVEPAVNRMLLSYGSEGIPDECYANSSTEGWILTVLILLLIVWLLQILFTLLMKKRFLELLTVVEKKFNLYIPCLLYTSPSPRDKRQSRMPSCA